MPKTASPASSSNPSSKTATNTPPSASSIFPPESRWPNLQNQATRPDIATLIDDAILAVERDNPNLKSKLPRDHTRRGIAPVKLNGLIDLIADIGFKGSRGKARDTLGRVYEYFLGKFAAAEGKLGGEFYTPRCIVRVLVEMLEPYSGRVYNPCCGSGGMFVLCETSWHPRIKPHPWVLYEGCRALARCCWRI